MYAIVNDGFERGPFLTSHWALTRRALRDGDDGPFHSRCIFHGFPSQAEGRIYLVAAGVPEADLPVCRPVP